MDSLNREIVSGLEELAKTFFVDASGCHDWAHVDRVRNLALNIGEKEGADLPVIEIAALLHDIARKEEMTSKGAFCHAERGAEMAKDILASYEVDLVVIEKITHAILTHRFRNSHIPETIEAKVLYDADKLDSIGAIGVARACLFAGAAGSGTIYTGNEKNLAAGSTDYSYTNEDSAYLEYEVKLKFIKDRMLTKTGREMAIERNCYMEEFFRCMWQEVRGRK